jgi:hypothetical protein
MGVKFARALGAYVVLFTTSPGKIDDGFRLGAHEVVVSKDANEMRKLRTFSDTKTPIHFSAPFIIGKELLPVNGERITDLKIRSCSDLSF